MKPFVAIDGVLDYLFAKYFGSVSVDDCAQTEIACCPYGPVRGPSIFQPRTGPYAEHAISDLSQSAFKMHTQVAAGALIFSFRQSYSATELKGTMKKSKF